MKRLLTRTGHLLLLGAICVAALPAGAGGRTQTAGELDSVRARITQLMKELDTATGRRSAAERELRSVEKSEQAARRELLETRKQVAAARARQQTLRAQEQTQQDNLSAERAALEQQLRLAYINGPEERLRLLLSQGNATNLGRQLIYAGYVSRQRSADIRGLQAQVAELQTTQQALKTEVAALVALEAQAADQLAAITVVRGERAQLLASISADVASADSQMAKLRAQEKELTNLLEKLARTLPQRPIESSEPFAGQAASLSWPAEGPLLKRFGDPRADGSLKWSGVLLGAPAGAEVRAVYHGRVVFADWLSGMGLLTILEHDDGYMSLYGHNQDLLKGVGEWVSPGEPIAHVGDSGGQASAGLYFEIRKDGDPVNPQRWIADR